MARTPRSSALGECNVVDLLPVGKPVEPPPHFSILDTPTDPSLINGLQLDNLVFSIREAVGHLKHHPHAHRSVQNYVARRLGAQQLKNLPAAQYQNAKALIDKLRQTFISHSIGLWSLEQRFLRDLFDEQEGSAA